MANVRRGLIPLFVFMLIFALVTEATFAQHSGGGSISGRLVDSETGEPIIGAAVIVENTTIGDATDLEGYYSIASVPDGVHTLIIHAIGYATSTARQVIVKSDQTVTLNLALMPKSLIGQDVIVEARAIRNTEASLLKQREKSGTISDAVSIETLTRSGGGNAADAMLKVTGASVVSGRYVYIRGLGDRYSKAQLNGTALPSADPDKNTFQMDLIPANLLDNIVVTKSFSPEKPGDFSGGTIDIGTRSFPESFMLKVSGSSSYDGDVNFNHEYLTYPGGKTDWLGLDDGTRGVPGPIVGSQIPDISFAFTDPTDAHRLDELSKSFNSTMAPTRKAPLLNQGYGFTVGNKTALAGRQFGYLASLSYNRKYSFYQNGEIGRYRLAGNTDQANALTTDFRLNDNRGDNEVLWGGLLTTSYKLDHNNEISLNYIRAQSAESTARYLSGKFYDGNLPENAVYETRVLKYVERVLNSVQLNGKHHLPGLAGMTFNWIGAYSKNNQDEPDLRFFSDHYEVSGSDTSYTIRPGIYTVPQRYFRNLDEDNLSLDLKFSLPLDQLISYNGKFDFGAFHAMKNRRFREKIYEYHNQDPNSYNGDPSEYFSNDNVGIIDSTDGFYTFGNYIVDASELRSNYDGDQNISAAFGMLDMPLARSVRMIGGVRYETTDMTIKTQDLQTYGAGNLNNKDLLPSASLIFGLAQDVNLRAAYGRTLARPTFRELAPFPSWDFANGFFMIGNPDLKRTIIDNLDLRGEWYPRSGEIVAASVFYKGFDNPIERAIKNDNGEIQYQNVPAATVYGLELELRKRLDFLSAALKDFNLSTNFALIHSAVDIPASELVVIRTYNPDAKNTRQLQGQSPYLVNIDLAYGNRGWGTLANLSFNVSGERLSEVSLGGTPDIFEQPRPELNFIINQQLLKQFGLRFSVKNMLDSPVSKVHHYKGTDYIYQQYSQGRAFGLGFSCGIS